MPRHLFSGSKFNRDRREDAFARSVIAEAERRRRQAETEARDTAANAECDYCGKVTCDGKCPQYYEAMQDYMEESYEDD